jgi:hypothetical protein
MVYADLFGWWIATIAWSIAFPIAVSLYLYRGRTRGKAANLQPRFGRLKDFTFVYFLLGLLVFYIVTVSQGSALLFAVGNIGVEALLLLYVFVGGREGTGQAR